MIQPFLDPHKAPWNPIISTSSILNIVIAFIYLGIHCPYIFISHVCVLHLYEDKPTRLSTLNFFFFFEFYKLETNSLVKMDKLYASKRIFQWKNWVKLYMHIFDNQRYHITEVLNWIISSSIMSLPLILQSVIIGNQMDELQLEEV